MEVTIQTNIIAVLPILQKNNFYYECTKNNIINSLRSICKLCKKIIDTEILKDKLKKTITNLFNDKNLEIAYINLNNKHNNVNKYTIDSVDEKKLVILKHINLDFIKLLCDESKIKTTDYKYIEQMNRYVFLEYIKNIIDENKYKSFDFSKEYNERNNRLYKYNIICKKY